MDSLCSPLKSGVFFGTFGCTGKGYVERELLSLRSRGRGVLIQGLLFSLLNSGGFGGTFGCIGKGYVERELLLLWCKGQSKFRSGPKHNSAVIPMYACMQKNCKLIFSSDLEL